MTASVVVPRPGRWNPASLGRVVPMGHVGGSQEEEATWANGILVTTSASRTTPTNPTRLATSSTGPHPSRSTHTLDRFGSPTSNPARSWSDPLGNWSDLVAPHRIRPTRSEVMAAHARPDSARSDTALVGTGCSPLNLARGGGESLLLQRDPCSKRRETEVGGES